MKAALFAIVVLVGVDAFANHGAGLHAFIAGLAGFGRGIGAWIYYSG